MKNLNKKKQNHTSHIAPHTSQKGITLIALIITIIVMLILVGVTINVALNGGLFQKADDATKLTQEVADKEELQLEIVTAYNEKEGTVNLDLLKTNLEAKNWKDVTISGDKLTCTSPKGNTFTITVEENGNIKVEYQEGIIGAQPIDNLSELKAKVEGKTFNEVMESFGPVKFKDTDISFVEFGEGKIIVNYKQEQFVLLVDEEKIYLVERDIRDKNDYFEIEIDGENAIITGLTDNGSSSLASSKKLVIPKTIIGTDKNQYNVIELAESCFSGNLNIESLEIENGNRLIIGMSAFADCVNLTGNLNIPSSVEIIGVYAFTETGITGLTLNEGKLNTIERAAFARCENLTGTVNIPSTVTIINSRPFGETNLTELIINNSEGAIEGAPWGLDTTITKITYTK